VLGLAATQADFGGSSRSDDGLPRTAI